MSTDEHLHRELSQDIIGAAMTGYLAITDLRLALLFNFKEAKLRWKRVIR